MKELIRLIFMPVLFNKKIIKGIMAIDKTSDEINRSITSNSPFFQNTQLQANPGIKRRNIEPKTIRKDCIVGIQKFNALEIRVNTKIANIELFSHFFNIYSTAIITDY